MGQALPADVQPGRAQYGGLQPEGTRCDPSGAAAHHPFTLTPEHPRHWKNCHSSWVIYRRAADLMMGGGQESGRADCTPGTEAAAPPAVHLVLATQRPSGRRDYRPDPRPTSPPVFHSRCRARSIRAPSPTRWRGSLLGQGDMLYLPPGSGYPQRGARRIRVRSRSASVIQHIKSLGEPQYIDGVLQFAGRGRSGEEGGSSMVDAEADRCTTRPSTSW